MSTTPPALVAKPLRPLKGVRILSLALNLPGPAALMRCRDMGATCVKLEPPPHPSAPKGSSGDPMGLYNRAAYEVMHAGMKISSADLKTEAGQKVLHKALASTDILLTSFRPSALKKLGLEWKALHKRYPQLSVVAIVGAPGARAEEPGHDLTYLAENALVTGLDLPPTLYADMAGSLMTSEAVLQARLLQLQKGKGVYQEVALSVAAGYLALPRTWGLTAPGAAVGGGHAGYRVYPCQDGRVALAALEPHFAAALAAEVGLRQSHILAMFAPETHTAIAAYLAGKTRQQLDALATAKDIPLYTLA
ncbi:MAG: CoA-transferase [Curvibacter sp. RIFCSPHIGHO2_12_FULL_63_18]|uniref:CoA transferase n=1 Tax=Rhodoferax sp. TaxID=50421 RepID=UPI0008B7FC20|nr:CoA transferase [Rhodoferax sp.]OGO96745.1 MAG: CoA-transferase [Curvibacter sp. GWA2_63_95]OGP00923.1 MAG: CoA-transferase [Curvibacter sp. RIFCSPHIGHO2_12_FULL_63_18]HCX80489.1 CoA transferase [Rhodoferax sp.]